MAGSDSPTPYTVTSEGVTLPEGVTFQAHGHINIKITTADGTYIRDVNMHFDPNNGHPGGAYIGESFFPVDLADGECIGWVQIHGFNEHFGEGGQIPVCVEPETPVVEIPEKPTPEFREVVIEGDPNCETFTVEIVTHKESAGYYLGNDNEWHLGEFFPTGNPTVTTRETTQDECPAPPGTEEETDETPENENPIPTPEVETVTSDPATQPETLAVTGAGAEWATLIVGLALVAAGLVVYLKRVN